MVGRMDEIQRQYLQGHITNEERYNRVIEVWSSTNELITNELMDELKKDNEGFNPVYMMAHSGARGSRTQIRQLGGTPPEPAMTLKLPGLSATSGQSGSPSCARSIDSQPVPSK